MCDFKNVSHFFWSCTLGYPEKFIITQCRSYYILCNPVNLVFLLFVSVHSECSDGTSEWENLLDQHKVCEKKVAANKNSILDLDKQLKEVQQLLHKEKQWSIGFMHSGPNRTSGGPSLSGLDILKIYRTICSFKCDIKW